MLKKNNSRSSRKIIVGDVAVGGGAPVSIQSMTKTDTRDAAATAAQIRRLRHAGCQIVRVAIPDAAAAAALPAIIAGGGLPVVADIHFDYRLALKAIRHGVHGIRINPGNIGGADRVKAVAEAAGEAGIPIRVGANSGSLPKEKMRKNGGAGKKKGEKELAERLVESALAQCELLERYGFKDIKVSLKSTSPTATIAAYRRFAAMTDYPLHLGVTEAGTLLRSCVRSAIGIGALLLEGIGDTVRVSVTGDPVDEVRIAQEILVAVGLRQGRPEIVSCPTCGRTAVDLLPLVERIEREIERMKTAGRGFKPVKIAVMGCAVNGPGEACDAALGISGGKGRYSVFKYGESIGSFPEREALQVFLRELSSFVE